jgi:hypothetical protein
VKLLRLQPSLCLRLHQPKWLQLKLHQPKLHQPKLHQPKWLQLKLHQPKLHQPTTRLRAPKSQSSQQGMCPVG